MADNPQEVQNVFDLLARLLFLMRHSLEDVEVGGRPPRWVRIARARVAQGDADFLGKGVKLGAEGFAEALSFSVEITLALREMLIQTDATEAFVELAWDIVSNADTIVTGSTQLFGKQFNLDALQGFKMPKEFDQFKDKAGDILKGIMNIIPGPEDIDNLGHELYLLLCIDQLAIPHKDGSVDVSAIPTTLQEHLNIANSGKARLMQWAFGSDTLLWFKKPGQTALDKQGLRQLGGRRVWKTDTAKLPTASVYKQTIGREEVILLDLDFKNNDDLYEVNTVLEILGYNEPAISETEKRQFGPNLAQRLRYFQAFNDLPITGELDNATINRLMNLDYNAKNLTRTKRYDSAKTDIINRAKGDVPLDGMLTLVNPMADTPKDEFLEAHPHPTLGGYNYYEAGHTVDKLPQDWRGGWISDREDSAIAGFVALESRIVVKKQGGQFEFDGGIETSEGESASGRMFFAARLVEPWKAGRKKGLPAPEALFDSHLQDKGLTPGSKSCLYQWVPLKGLKPPAGYKMFIQASVLQRSLCTDRNQVTNKPDQGRIAVELYDDTVFKSDDTVFKGLSTPRTAENKSKLRAETDWFPEHTTVAANLSQTQILRNRNWSRRVTAWLEVPEGTTAVLVALEGLHQSGWDIDAYFDNVELFYKFDKKPPA
ncbi:MAG: peptidoglycan-binding domain-containing protein [Candidatus Competibacteraceae bacterium]